MAIVLTLGTLAASADPVVTPTNLVPGLPTRTAGDWMFCFTASTSTTATVATPSGWTLLAGALGANGRVVMFSRKAAGGAGDTAPTVAWSGLTTGLAGTPCDAHIACLAGANLLESGGNLVLDATGTVSDQAADVTVMAGGSALVVSAAGALVWGMGVRRDDAASGITDAGTGLVWTGVFADQTTSGTDMLTAASYGILASPSTVGTHTWNLTGSTSVTSSGLMFALKPPVDPVVTTLYTKARLRFRPFHD